MFPVRNCPWVLKVKIPVEADVIKSIIRSYRQTVNICLEGRENKISCALMFYQLRLDVQGHSLIETF